MLTDKVMIERIGDIDNLSVLFSAVFSSVSMMVKDHQRPFYYVSQKRKKNSEEKVFKSNV